MKTIVFLDKLVISVKLTPTGVLSNYLPEVFLWFYCDKVVYRSTEIGDDTSFWPRVQVKAYIRFRDDVYHPVQQVLPTTRRQRVRAQDDMGKPRGQCLAYESSLAGEATYLRKLVGISSSTTPTLHAVAEGYRRLLSS